MSEESRSKATKFDQFLWWLVLSALVAALILIVLKKTGDLNAPLAVIFVLAGVGFGVPIARPSVSRARPWTRTWL